MGEGTAVVDGAVRLHRNLGPGLLQTISVYPSVPLCLRASVRRKRACSRSRKVTEKQEDRERNRRRVTPALAG